MPEAHCRQRHPHRPDVLIPRREPLPAKRADAPRPVRHPVRPAGPTRRVLCRPHRFGGAPFWMPISSIGQRTDAGKGRCGYFFSVTVIAGDSCGLSVGFVNSPIGSAVDVDRT
jgi:hypothetical protein